MIAQEQLNDVSLNKDKIRRKTESNRVIYLFVYLFIESRFAAPGKNTLKQAVGILFVVF